jgi:FkbM family methyltransferase
LAWRGRTFLVGQLRDDISDDLARLRDDISGDLARLREAMNAALQQEQEALLGYIRLQQEQILSRAQTILRHASLQEQRWVELVRSMQERLLATEARTQRMVDEALRRITAYAGENITECYLRGGIPLLVNSANFGLPAALIAGIPWEPENLDILLSFLRPDSVVLDVGANVGYFSILLGRRLAEGGQVHAIEPHPDLTVILRRNVLINSLEKRVTVHCTAASDACGQVEIFYPDEHLGGGSIHVKSDELGRTIIAPAVRLDDLLPAGFRAGIVKIDVELHELAVLKGMRQIISRSPEAVFLFEKLSAQSQDDDAIQLLLREGGYQLYGVGAFAELIALGEEAFGNWSGYVVAGNAGVIAERRRARFSLYPQQLHGRFEMRDGRALYRAREGQVLFSGPNWPLAPGPWRFRLQGDLRGALTLRLTDEGAFLLGEHDLSDLRREGTLQVPRSVDHFEAVGVAGSVVELALDRIDFLRLA